MKKAIMVCAVLFFSISVTHAQNGSFFNTRFRIELMDFLVSMREASPDYDIRQFGPNHLLLSISNLLTMQDIDLFNDQYEYGIYSFKGPKVHGTKHIFFKKKNEYQILQMNSGDWLDESGTVIIKGRMDFEEIILELFQYFKDNPDVNPQLLPLYTKAVCSVYFENYKLMAPTSERIKLDYERILNGEKLGNIR